MARHNRAAEAAPKKSPRASAAKASKRLADPKLERLARKAADRGLHPLPVARRIISRMAAARSYEDAPMSGTWMEHGVRTGYNTDWHYAIEKLANGYAVRFVPKDLEARRAGKGPHQLGGYIAPSTSARGFKLTGDPHAYRTQAEARKAAVGHMGTGGYLTYQNPAVAPSRRMPTALKARKSAIPASRLEELGYEAARGLSDATARRSKAIFTERALGNDERFERLTPTQLAAVKKGIAHRYETMQRYFRNQDSGPMDMPYPRYNPESDESFNARVLRATGKRLRSIPRYPLKEGDPMPGSIAVKRGDQYIVALREDEDFDGNKIYSDYRLVDLSDLPPRSNPRDWAIAYEGRLRDMTRASDGLIRVEKNPTDWDLAFEGNLSSLNHSGDGWIHVEQNPRARVVKARRGGSAARAAGLAKGQSLMSQAARAFHAGQYDSMSEALKGVSKKRR